VCRNPDGTAAACGTITSATTRGFTGQEMMDLVCYVNFNARVYDPSLGRFMSPDPVTQTFYDLQILNRYSYVDNNPLSLTDPSGLCFLGCFWQNPIFDVVLDIALAYIGLPWLEAELPEIQIGAGASTAGVFGAQTAGQIVLNAGIAGGITGYISTGKLGGALISAGSAAAFAGLIPGGNFAAQTTATQIGMLADDFVAAGMIGGLTSVAQGGKFQSGFLSAGVGTLAGPLTGPGFSPEGTLASAVLGGFASELGGGKFANGAITAAFAYAAEACTSDGCDTITSSNQTSPGGSDAQNSSATQDQVPHAMVIASSTVQGSQTIYIYQVVNSEFDPLIAPGVEVEENVQTINKWGPTNIELDTTGGPVPLRNGQLLDAIGPQIQPGANANGGIITDQSFTAIYDKEPIPLTTVFQHETAVVNGVVTNTIKVITP